MVANGRRTVYDWLAAISIILCLVMVGMQCVARGKCPAEQGAHWSPINGTVCYGERP